jgi:hypothetical protein
MHGTVVAVLLVLAGIQSARAQSEGGGWPQEGMLAVRIVRGFPNNSPTVSPSTVEVSVDVLDPDHDCRLQGDFRAPFDQDDRASVADIHLSAVICDSYAALA